MPDTYTLTGLTGAMLALIRDALGTMAQYSPPGLRTACLAISHEIARQRDAQGNVSRETARPACIRPVPVDQGGGTILPDGRHLRWPNR